MQRRWWKESVVYQVYPRSFKDSGGDGIGDLNGITQKLDYLAELGVDVVWLSPVYRSPNDDNGYDISDYHAIMDDFGTLAEWERMVSRMHERGMKLVMDLVVNHTSDEHPWFVDAKSSRESRYRDYYIWRPERSDTHAGAEPNNWASFFGGSAWAYNPATDDYYLHLFSRKQPDLNWENPELRNEIYRMMRWWLEKGADGFRMDVINMISKAPGLPDARRRDDAGYQFGGEHFIHGPRLLEFLNEMNREVLSKYDIMTIGETPMTSAAQALEMTHEERGPLQMVFQFEHVGIDEDPAQPLPRRSVVPWRLQALKEIITRWQETLDGVGWNSNYLNNHDQPRSVSRFGNDQRYRVESATLLATFTHMLHGTPFIYQGEEIGMTNVRFPSISYYKDIETRDIYRELTEERRLSPEDALRIVHAKSRDNARTPMQWDASANAGFTDGTPWLSVNPNYVEINVDRDRKRADSIFAYYQKLISLRKRYPVIVYGGYELLLPDDEQLFVFTRTVEREQLLVVLNFSEMPARCQLPGEVAPRREELLIGNYAVDDVAGAAAVLELRPYEARVYYRSQLPRLAPQEERYRAAKYS